jgi:hypothetical protein
MFWPIVKAFDLPLADRLRATRIAEIGASAMSAKHSRVQSLTTTKMRKRNGHR